jgi:hypothetical protein
MVAIFEFFSSYGRILTGPTATNTGSGGGWGRASGGGWGRAVMPGIVFKC